MKEQALTKTPSLSPAFSAGRRVLLAALLLGYSVDLLFYGKSLGISLLAFVLLLVSTLWSLGRAQAVRPAWRNLWLLVPLFFFAGMAAVRANPFVTLLNVSATLALLTYLAFFFAAGRVEALSLPGVALLPWRVGGNSLSQAVPLVRENVDLGVVRRQGRRSLFPLLRGGLLALPVLFVFTLLLASADLVFADFVQNVLSLRLIPQVLELIWRGWLVLMAAWMLAGSLAYALARRQTDDERSALEKGLESLPLHLSLGFIEALTVLVLVNLLFLTFTAIQFTYLFGGEANINLQGYTYADYARRGFFELVAVAVLALALILGLNWITRRENKRQIRLFNALGSLMVLFVLVMLVSAFLRLRLYESIYGYTELRLYVYVFMAWLGALLLWFLVTLWRRPDRFAIGLIITVLGFVATLNAINPDAFIVRQNLARYQATGKLDAAYLTTLSADAVPGLMVALQQVQGDSQLVPTPICRSVWNPVQLFWEAKDCEATPAQILQAELDHRYQHIQQNPHWRRWQSWHLSRWRAYWVLEQ